MKLDYFNVLRKKSTPDEIAEQIVALEIKQKQCEAQRDKARKVCKEIRGRAMCGEKMPPDVIRNADKDHEDASLDLEIVVDSIADLHKVLDVALEAFCAQERIRDQQIQREINDKQPEIMRMLFRAQGRLIGIATAVYGVPEIAQEMLMRTNTMLSLGNESPYLADYSAGLKEGKAQLGHPTIEELRNVSQALSLWLAQWNAEREHEQIVDRHRKKASASESVPQASEEAVAEV